MSLDVYLTDRNVAKRDLGSGIFIHEDGQMRQISREEWDVRFPGREPVVCPPDEFDGRVYQGNITHNLTEMARTAGIYAHLWSPEKIGITKARELIAPLAAGLERLRADPDGFRKHNPPNGWGSYEGLIRFVSDYLVACIQHPDADVSVWR